MNTKQPISTFLGIAAAVGVLVSSSYAAIINVPGDALTIQAGIDAAINGDEVVVAQGTYFETINFNGKAITVRSTDPNDPVVVMNTIINGGRGVGRVVSCSSGEGPNTVLNGFVITGGNASGMVNANFSSPTVTNCTFSANSASDGGGMGNFQSSSPTVTNCTFTGNSASGDGGGGMYNNNSSPTVTDCTFSGNSARNAPGLLQSAGGGMFNFNNSSPTVTNSTFTGNMAANIGGGMYTTISASPTLTNTGLCNNTPDDMFGLWIDCGDNTVCDGNLGESCPPCPTDVNGDGVTNVLDLIDLLLCYDQPAVPGCESEDVAVDGTVNVIDLIFLLLQFGQSCL